MQAGAAVSQSKAAVRARGTVARSQGHGRRGTGRSTETVWGEFGRAARRTCWGAKNALFGDGRRPPGSRAGSVLFCRVGRVGAEKHRKASRERSWKKAHRGRVTDDDGTTTVVAKLCSRGVQAPHLFLAGHSDAFL